MTQELENLVKCHIEIQRLWNKLAKGFPMVFGQYVGLGITLDLTSIAENSTGGAL